MKKLFLFAISFALLLSGCSIENNTGNFELYLTDEPIEGLEQVLITICTVKVQKDDGSTLTVWEGEKTYDLLELRDIEERILDIELEQGSYTHIRIAICGASVVVDGRTYEINLIHSIEVKIPVTFFVLNDSVTEVVLDFDADQSISGYGDLYTLIPVITVERVTQ